MKAALYVRVSTSKQEEEGTSLESQETACREYAIQHGFEIDEAHVYREVHTGIELWERPQLTRLREAVRARQVGAVIAYAIDRLARDPVHLGVVISEAEHRGAVIEFVTEPLDNSPEGQLIRFVRGYAAKVEHEKIRERSMRGKLSRVASGKIHNQGTEMYGWRRDKEAGVRHLYEPEAIIVRQVYRWVGEEGVPIRTVIRRLNDAGVPPPSAGKRTFKDPDRKPRWGSGAVMRLLTDPGYKGETLSWRWKSNPKRHQSELRPPEEWLRLPDGITPAIVSPALWEVVQARLAANRGGHLAAQERYRQYLLRGMIACAVCGGAMRASPEKGKRHYRCSSRERPGGACGGRRVYADEVEERVWNRVAAALKNPAEIAAELQRRREEGQDDSLQADRELLQRQLGKLEKQQERLLRRYRESDDETGFPWELVEREIALAEEEKRRIRSALAELAERMARSQAAIEQWNTLSHYCARVAENLERFDFETKRFTLLALQVRVLANGPARRGEPAEVRVRGQIPLEGDDTQEERLFRTSCSSGRPARERRCWRSGS